MVFFLFGARGRRQGFLLKGPNSITIHPVRRNRHHQSYAPTLWLSEKVFLKNPVMVSFLRQEPLRAQGGGQRGDASLEGDCPLSPCVQASKLSPGFGGSIETLPWEDLKRMLLVTGKIKMIRKKASIKIKVRFFTLF